MAKSPYQMPSLKMLRSFEAAARNGSIKDAAAELFVTPSAVSHQIKSLEQELGISLFQRSHRSMELTTEGWVLKEAVSRGFSEITRAVHILNKTRDVKAVTIGSTTAVSSLWLTPIISQIWRHHPEITINQEVRDRPFSRPMHLDLIIEYSTKPPLEPADILFDDILVPLCSPEYDQPESNSLDAIAQSNLIHLDAKETNWTSWGNWFASLDYTTDIPKMRRVNNYAIALQLAQDGMGVVLGWKRLVAPLLDAKKLVPYGEFENKAPGKFYLVQSEISQSDAIDVVKRQLLIESNSLEAF